MKKRQRIGIIPAGSLASPNTNVVNDTNRGIVIVCTINTANPCAELCQPIAKGGTYTLQVITPKVERTQIMAIGLTDETIVAGARYGVQIGNHTIKDQSEYIQPSKYAYTAPTILSGSADTDRYNVYASLAGKINSYANNHVAAYVLHKINYTAGTSGTGVIGTTTVSPLMSDYTAGLDPGNKLMAGSAGVQTTTNYTMNIAAITISSGAFPATAAAGTVWIYNLIDPTTGVYPVGGITTNDIITFTATVPMSATAENLILGVVTVASFKTGQGMVIVDDAGYNTPNVYPNRTGKSEIQLYGDWVTATTVTEVRTGYYSRGIGSDLLARVPQYGLEGHDQFIRGNNELELYDPTNTFVATRAYSKVIINAAVGASISSMSNELNPLETQQIIYVDNGALTAYASYNAEGINACDLFTAALAAAAVLNTTKSVIVL